MEKFTLTASHVPQEPASRQWSDLLRWLVCIMDPDDKRLSFVAGCLSHTLKFGGLSDRQCAACEAILNSVKSDLSEGILLCQNIPDEACDVATSTGRTLN